jgi:hypothetical protein
MERSESEPSKDQGFKNYEKNEAFPIHANIFDSDMD